MCVVLNKVRPYWYVFDGGVHFGYAQQEQERGVHRIGYNRIAQQGVALVGG